jgi:hypothetical protein
MRNRSRNFEISKKFCFRKIEKRFFFFKKWKLFLVETPEESFTKNATSFNQNQLLPGMGI